MEVFYNLCACSIATLSYAILNGVEEFLGQGLRESVDVVLDLLEEAVQLLDMAFYFRECFQRLLDDLFNAGLIGQISLFHGRAKG